MAKEITFICEGCKQTITMTTHANAERNKARKYCTQECYTKHRTNHPFKYNKTAGDTTSHALEGHSVEYYKSN